MKLQSFTLKNQRGMAIEFLNYGGIVTKMMVPDRSGKVTNVVLAFPDVNEYLKHNPSYYGAIIGRVANRIAGAQFTIHGKSYTLAKNDGENALHGGKVGFDKVFWKVKELEKNQRYELSYLSPDGEEGYPGNLQARITYSLDEENTFTIKFGATTDKATHVNLTHHSYFNLSGERSSTILEHELQINSKLYTVSDDAYLPTGEIRPVENEVDFTQFKKIGEHIHFGPDGYNHNYVLNNHGQRKCVATLRHADSGREMKVFTTQPGLQLYSGFYLEQPYRGVALETQHYPDSANHPQFPSTLLTPGEIYEHEVSYTFSILS
jgi:aldose 1-epimerase